MIAQNKLLLIGALACLGVYGSVQMLLVQSNWSEAGLQLNTAEQNREKWDDYYKPEAGQKLLPRPEAEAAIKASNQALQRKLDELRQIEFGTPDTLHLFSLAAAKGGDPKNYLASSITTMRQRAKGSLSISVPIDLGIADKASDDPVALNLLRLAMVDRLLTACKEAGVPAVLRLKYGEPAKISPAENAAGENSGEREPRRKEGSGKDGGKDGSAAPDPDLLVKFPMRVVVAAPERAFAQLLFEIQKPSDGTHGYFCLRGFHVYVRDSNSGLVEGALALNALLSSKTAAKLQIPVKEPDERRGAPRQQESDLYRY